MHDVTPLGTALSYVWAFELCIIPLWKAGGKEAFRAEPVWPVGHRELYLEASACSVFPDTGVLAHALGTLTQVWASQVSEEERLRISSLLQPYISAKEEYTSKCSALNAVCILAWLRLYSADSTLRE